MTATRRKVRQPVDVLRAFLPKTQSEQFWLPGGRAQHWYEGDRLYVAHLYGACWVPQGSEIPADMLGDEAPHLAQRISPLIERQESESAYGGEIAIAILHRMAPLVPLVQFNRLGLRVTFRNVGSDCGTFLMGLRGPK